MFMKLASLLVTYMAGRTAHATHENGEGGFFSNLTFGAMKKAVRILCFYVASLVVFIFGATIITADLIISTKQVGAITLTELSWVGLAIIAVAGIAATVVSFIDFSGDTISWKKTKKQVQHSTTSIGDAVTMLVMDFMQDRRARRESSEMERRTYAARANSSRSSDTMSSHMN